MYFYVESAKGPRIDHAKRSDTFMPPVPFKRTIKRGERCLVFSNGTIGPGCITYNYSKPLAISMLRGLIAELQTSTNQEAKNQ